MAAGEAERLPRCAGYAAATTTEVSYRVDSTLHGKAKIATPLFAVVLHKIADDGAKELQKTVCAAVASV